MESKITCCANVCLKAWQSTVQEISINNRIALVPKNKDNKVEDVWSVSTDHSGHTVNQTIYMMQAFTIAMCSYRKHTT